MNWREERASEAWVLQAVEYYRNLDFFAQWADLSDQEIAGQVKAYHGEISWYDFIQGTSTRAEGDMFLLMADVSRVWFRDLECVYRNANAYKEVIQEWAAISRGVFTPERISETWVSDEGPVEVMFEYKGRHQIYIHQDGRDDFINLDILRMVNGLLYGQTYYLEAADNLGDCRFIVALSGFEKERIRRDRGWTFCDFVSAQGRS